MNTARRLSIAPLAIALALSMAALALAFARAPFGVAAYAQQYGALERGYRTGYSDGYQQGYEVGYDAGYKRAGFDSNIPAGGVSRRGATPRDSSDAGESSSSGR